MILPAPALLAWVYELRPLNGASLTQGKAQECVAKHPFNAWCEPHPRGDYPKL